MWLLHVKHFINRIIWPLIGTSLPQRENKHLMFSECSPSPIYPSAIHSSPGQPLFNFVSDLNCVENILAGDNRQNETLDGALYVTQCKKVVVYLWGDLGQL